MIANYNAPAAAAPAAGSSDWWSNWEASGGAPLTGGGYMQMGAPMLGAGASGAGAAGTATGTTGTSTGSGAGGVVTSVNGIAPPGSTAGQVTPQSIALGQQQYQQLPGYNQDLSNIGANIGAETAGQLPADVIRNLQQGAAERGIATGTAGSGDNNAAYLRALGLTSLDMTNMGQGNFNKALPMLPGLSQNPTFYTNPGQVLQAGISGAQLANQKYEFGAQQQANDRALQEAKAGFGAGLGAGGPLGSIHMPSAGPAMGGLGLPTLFGGGGSGAGNVTLPSLGDATMIGGVPYEPGQRLPGQQNPLDSILRNYAPGNAGTGMSPDSDLYGTGYEDGTNPSATAPAGTSSGYYYAGENPDSYQDDYFGE